MKKLFQVKGVGVTWYFDEKKEAKECRDAINARLKKNQRPTCVQIGPDHWRYNK